MPAYSCIFGLPSRNQGIMLPSAWKMFEQLLKRGLIKDGKTKIHEQKTVGVHLYLFQMFLERIFYRTEGRHFMLLKKQKKVVLNIWQQFL